MSYGNPIALYRTTDMKPIMVVYPGYQALPKGLKQLLVESESFFFEEETTFFRRDRKADSTGANADRFSVGQPLSKSWIN
jgi:hypothetical protein